MTKRTIYFYGVDNKKGGMENYALNLIRGILNNSSNILFHIISEYNDFAFKQEFINLGCTYSVLPNKRKRPLKYFRELKKILKKANSNDLFQINAMSYRNFFLFKAAKKSKIRTIVVGHGSNCNSLFKKLVHNINRFIFRKLGVKVGNNQDVIDFFFGKKCKNYEIIKTGIDYEKFLFSYEKRQDFRNKYNLEDNDLVIGQIGRLSYEKNQLFSSEIIKSIHDDSIKLFIIGNADNLKLKTQIQKMSKNIIFTGEINNVADIYSGLDLFAFPSLHESAGFALYEAVASGLTCLISDNIPLEDVTSEKISVINLDKEKWIKSILNFKENYKFSEKERNIISNVPSLNEQVNDYLELYKKLTK